MFSIQFYQFNLIIDMEYYFCSIVEHNYESDDETGKVHILCSYTNETSHSSINKIFIDSFIELRKRRSE